MRPRFRLRWLPYLALALVVPLRAFGGGSGGLGVSASLGGCGLSGTEISCNVTASFNKLGDAQYYTAQIVRPDSTVQGFGAVASGSGGGRASVTLPVTYTGAGTYTVTISAYGSPKEETRDKPKKPELIEKGKAETVPEGLPSEQPPTDTTTTTTPDITTTTPDTTTTPTEPPVEPAPCPNPSATSGDPAATGADGQSSADPATSAQDPCQPPPPSTSQTDSATPPPN